MEYLLLFLLNFKFHNYLEWNLSETKYVPSKDSFDYYI